MTTVSFMLLNLYSPLTGWDQLVRLIKMTIQNAEASVKIENLTSKPFSVSPGVPQGDPLSTKIFNFILDSVIKLNLRGDAN